MENIYRQLLDLQDYSVSLEAESVNNNKTNAVLKIQSQNIVYRVPTEFLSSDREAYLKQCETSLEHLCKAPVQLVLFPIQLGPFKKPSTIEDTLTEEYSPNNNQLPLRFPYDL